MATTSLDDISKGNANPIASFSKFLDGYKGQLALALPKHLNADRMARLVLTAFSQSAQLQECEPRTIIAAVVTASQMGLEIGVSGQGYLIPYKRTCTFVPGWQGIVDIVNRTGRASVWTGAVFKGDVFDYGLGDSPFVKHKPACETDDPADITHVYAIGRVNGSEWPVIEVWPIAKVRKHFKKMNKVGDRHYANQHWEMYARKIPLLQVCKYMPKSIELTAAMQMSHAADEGRGMVFDMDLKTVEPVDPQTGEIVDLDKRKDDGDGKPVGKTYAQYAALITGATSADTAALELDEARDVLPPAQQAELAEVYRNKFGGK